MRITKKTFDENIKMQFVNSYKFFIHDINKLFCCRGKAFDHINTCSGKLENINSNAQLYFFSN